MGSSSTPVHVVPTPAVKSGWRTSEFWLAALTMVVTPLLPALDNAVNSTAGSVASHNASNPWGMLGPVILASAYAVGRSYVKGQAVAPAPVSPPSP